MGTDACNGAAEQSAAPTPKGSAIISAKITADPAVNGTVLTTDSVGALPLDYKTAGKLKVARLREGSHHPEPCNGSDTYNFRAVEDTWLPAKGLTLIRTGVAVMLPANTTAAADSLSDMGLVISLGSFEDGCHGELGVVVFNSSELPATIRSGDPFLQLKLCPAEPTTAPHWCNTMHYDSTVQKWPIECPAVELRGNPAPACPSKAVDQRRVPMARTWRRVDERSVCLLYTSPSPRDS